MSIALYNPKFIETEGGKKIPNTANVERFIWDKASWQLKVNQMANFTDSVGQAMLKHIDFLIEVTPKNIDEIKKMMEVKAFKCEICGEEFGIKLALAGHMRSHEKDGSGKPVMEGIDEARPTNKFKGFSKTPGIMTPEQMEGIPDTSNGSVKDRDGVEFYGEGLQSDTTN